MQGHLTQSVVDGQEEGEEFAHDEAISTSTGGRRRCSDTVRMQVRNGLDNTANIFWKGCSFRLPFLQEMSDRPWI